jgi:ABC-type Fe3+/spermidine/putrescine transport system ATPase subunit
VTTPANTEAALACRGLAKRYPGQSSYALGGADGGVSFDVSRGELFALLGPSGCGKTTTLRIIGGFVPPSAGQVFIAGEDVTRKRPYARPTNTVFQSYALFPHMSVGSNVAFGLAMHRVPRPERRRRVAEALALVGLPGWEDRRVTELSGGQAQRCALARSIVNRPTVLLLDEPLGALDLKLRREMQDELARLKASTDTTFVHVTHDQEEACAIADRIAVMEAGQIVQVDTPLDLYRSPRTSYVATFIDAGTLIRGRAVVTGDVLELRGDAVTVRGLRPTNLNGRAPVAAVVSPDRVRLQPGSDVPAGEVGRFRGVVDRIVFTGSAFEVHVHAESGLALRCTLSIDELQRLRGAVEEGATVTVSWRPEDVIFVEDTGDAPADNEAAEAPAAETGPT